MRSADELRGRWLERIPAMMARTGMYAATGQGMDTLCHCLLGDLCFLDDRDDDFDGATRMLRSYGKLGVAGPFEVIFARPRCQAEVAAAYAEIFHRLGYLTLDRQIARAEWEQLAGSLRGWFDGRDVRRSQAEQLLGTPSLRVDKGAVLCYAPAEAQPGWLFVDCPPASTTRYDDGMFVSADDPDPLVRSLRLSSRSFEDGLILTLYGKVLRWGPGWWIDHPGPDQTPEQHAIADQTQSGPPSRPDPTHPVLATGRGNEGPRIGSWPGGPPHVKRFQDRELD
jgi:hypothetical protein